MKTILFFLVAWAVAMGPVTAQNETPAAGSGVVQKSPAGPESGQSSAAQKNGPQGPTTPAARNDWEETVAQVREVGQRMGPRVKLVFDGDSITRGWTVVGKAVWEERFEKLGAFDFAIGGDKTQNVLWRLEHGQVDGLQPRMVVLLIGTNNTPRYSAEEVAAGIKAVVAEYRKRLPNAVILVQGIFPRGKKADDPLRAKIKAVNAEIAKLADGDKVLYVDFGDKFLQPDGTISPEIMPDFLHLSPKGYEIWADAIAPFLKGKS